MNKYIKYPLVLGLVALISGSLLAGTYHLTKDKIAQAKFERQTSAINDLFEKIDKKELVEVPDVFKQKGVDTIVKVTSNNKVYNCYTINSKDGAGGDEFSVIIALDSNAKVFGVKILSGDNYISKYNNESYLASVVKNNKFDSIVGATITAGDLNEALELAIDCYKGNVVDPIEEMFTSITSKTEMTLPNTIDTRIKKVYTIISDNKTYYVFDTIFNDTHHQDKLNVLYGLNEDGSLYKVKVVEGDSWAKKYDGSTNLDVIAKATESNADLKNFLVIVQESLGEVK